MRVCKHGCGVKVFCFSRANHASTNLKKFSSSKLDKFTSFTHSFVGSYLENLYKQAAWATDCVYTNSFRKVKLREKDSGARTSIEQQSKLLASHTNILQQVTQSIPPNVSVMWRRKVNYTGTLCRYSRQLKMKPCILFKKKEKKKRRGQKRIQ